MKKIRMVSFGVLMLSVMLWTAGRTFFPLPDWAVRGNGIVMLAAATVVVFSTVRVFKNS